MIFFQKNQILITGGIFPISFILSSFNIKAPKTNIYKYIKISEVIQKRVLLDLNNKNIKIGQLIIKSATIFIKIISEENKILL